MHCVACDLLLSQKELSRKSPTTGEDYLLCTKCLAEAGLLHLAVENPLVESDEEEILEDYLSIDDPFYSGDQ